MSSYSDGVEVLRELADDVERDYKLMESFIIAARRILTSAPWELEGQKDNKEFFTAMRELGKCLQKIDEK